MNKEKFKRKKIIVDKKLQFKFIYNIYIVMIILFIALGALLILSSSSEIAGSIYSKITKIKNTKEIFLGHVVKFSFLIMLVGFIIIFFQFLIFSHRIVGPIFRFKQSLIKLGEGDLTLKVHFRDKDELKDVAETFTRAVDQLNKRAREIKKSARAMEQVLARRRLLKSDQERLITANRQIKETLSSMKI